MNHSHNQVSPIILPPLLGSLQNFDFPHKLGICERLFGARIAKHGICKVRSAAGLIWQLDLRNPTHRWIVYGKYEGAPFINWAKQFLPKNGVVVDSGANIGQMLLYLAQWVLEGRYIAVEPGKEQAEWLSSCLQHYPYLPVELLPIGLGATKAELKLYNPGGSYIHGAWSQISETMGETIAIMPLAEVLQHRGIDSIDLWKLDVEGYELPALEGAATLLKKQKIKSLYVELGFNHGEQIKKYLQQFGYKCHCFDSIGRLQELKKLPNHTNGLFLPQ